MANWGSTIYAKRNDAHLAYRVSDGEGPTVIGLMPGFEPLSSISEPFARPAFDRVAAFGCSILAERRGVGESDPIDLERPPLLDDVVDDLVAVLDHLGADTAAVWGFYNAGLVAARAVVRHPHRFTKLALVNTYVRWWGTPELEGVSEYYQRMWEQEVEHGPDEELNLLAIVAPSVARNDEFREWWGDVGRRGASPRVALALGRADSEWDIEGDLAQIQVPTLVVHRLDNHFVPFSHAERLAAGIKGAELVAAPGVDFMGMIGDVDALWDPVEEFLTERPPRRDRQLAAVLFTDLVASTTRSAEEGDRRWARLFEEHHEVARQVVTTCGGRWIKSTGDGVLAVFPGAAAAIDAARRLRRLARGRDMDLRAGIHAGEIEMLSDDVTGIAVTIAARIMDRAGAGEILVSAVVPPLIVGSGIDFDERDEVDLKGVPGRWQLFSPTVVTSSRQRR
jgi:class 3 adenylate cyclase/pimeloyl-ACP methyl ester carboxylesterase